MLCIEHFLKLSKFLVELLRLFLFILILSLETGRIVRVNIAQANFVSRLDSIPASVNILWQSKWRPFPYEFLDVSHLVGSGVSPRECLITPNKVLPFQCQGRARVNHLDRHGKERVQRPLEARPRSSRSSFSSCSSLASLSQSL